MKHLFIKGIFGIVAVSLFIPSPAMADDEWEFVVAPYVLAPWIEGTTSLGRIEGADVEVDPGDILDTLNVGGMLQVEAHHESGFGASLNYQFMSLGDNASGPAGLVDLDVDLFQGVLEGYGAYRQELDQGVIDYYAGVRWWDIHGDATVSAPAGRVKGRFDEDWVDPVIGARWIPQITDVVKLILQGDIGGFGVASDFTWSAMAGAGWDVSDSTTLFASFRVLSVDYDTGSPGTSGRFSYNTETYGPMFGAAFRF